MPANLPPHYKEAEDRYRQAKTTTVLDFAPQIHKDFVQNLKFARIWGKEKYDGQMVQRDYVLRDGDIIEFHM